MDADKEAIIHVCLTYVRMAQFPNPTPLDEVAGILADDFLHSSSSGIVYEGKESNLALFRKSVQEIETTFTRLDLAFDIRSIKQFREAAIVFGKLGMEGSKLLNGERFQRKVWETLGLRRENGRWFITHEHSGLIRPTPSVR